MLSRRYFLAAGAGSLVALGLPRMTLAKRSSNRPTDPAIEPILNAECTLYRDGLMVARLDLVGFSSLSMLDSRLDQCILDFQAAVPVNIPEASYVLSHPTLGRFDVFLQPSGTLNSDEHDGLRYRACMANLRR